MVLFRMIFSLNPDRTRGTCTSPALACRPDGFLVKCSGNSGKVEDITGRKTLLPRHACVVARNVFRGLIANYVGHQSCLGSRRLHPKRMFPHRRSSIPLERNRGWGRIRLAWIVAWVGWMPVFSDLMCAWISCTFRRSASEDISAGSPPSAPNWHTHAQTSRRPATLASNTMQN